ncbi:MAG TPA: Flp pilus assembly protein CpaB [Candidatus Binatia bacterium]|nr:Flp pilus assembly protein CpaB [Candidatus Binatia bacterium]
METEFPDHSRRAKLIIVFGILLAVAAGGAAFYLVSRAQQAAGQGELARVPVVVAARTIPARKPIEPTDVAVREVPVDPTNANGVVADPAAVVGKTPAVTILEGQLVTTNLLASTQATSGFSILGPEETVGPDSDAWRAVSLTIPDERAVGGLLQPGQTVDVFVTATVNVPQDVVEEGRYYPDRSTKITYQDMVILARSGTYYVLRATLPVAEEISHLLASGTASFSLALRPEIDTRILDVSGLGTTTNRIIAKYGLPLPETYPSGSGALATPPPLPSPTAPAPSPSSTGASPSPSPAP